MESSTTLIDCFDGVIDHVHGIIGSSDGIVDQIDGVIDHIDTLSTKWSLVTSVLLDNSICFDE